MQQVNKISDSKQSAWDLFAIQLSGWISLPILATSVIILQMNSFIGAILTIIVGNAISWFIRLGIISMSYEKRQSTLDISAEYTGKIGKYFIAILLIVSTFSWFIAQTSSGSASITSLLHIKENQEIDQFTQISVFFGIVSTLFCMGGMLLLRKLSTISFPILFIGFIIILYLLPDKTIHTNNQPVSMAGLTLVLATNLGMTADLPTFFRHSQSWKASIIALTALQLASLGLGICSLYFGSIISKGFEVNQDIIFANESLRMIIIGFIFLSVICANVANVYSASVGWEIIAPKGLIGRKEYFILGLGLTTVFILVSDIFSPEFLLNISDSSLVNLAIVLLLGYLISQYKKKPPCSSEQIAYFIAWLLSTIVNIFQFSDFIFYKISPILVSIITITILTSLFTLTKHAWMFIRR